MERSYVFGKFFSEKKLTLKEFPSLKSKTKQTRRKKKKKKHSGKSYLSGNRTL